MGIFGTLLERRFGPLPVIAVFVLSGAAGMALAALIETPPLFTETRSSPSSAPTAPRSACSARGSSTTASRRAAAEDRDNDLLGVYVIAIMLVLLSLAEEAANIGAAVGGAVTGALLGMALPLFTRKSAVSDVFTDEQVEAALRALSDPERFAGAERGMAVLAPQLQRVLTTRSRRVAGSATPIARRCAPRSPSPTKPCGRSGSRRCSPRRPGWECWSGWRLAGSSPGNSTCKTNPEGD